VNSVAGIEKIVVLQTGFIGDVVLTTPLVFGLMERYPNAAVSIVVGSEKVALAKCIPGIDQVILFDKRDADAGLRGLFRAASRLRRHRFDLLVAPHRSSRTALLGAWARIPRRIGFWIGPAGLLFTDRVRIRRSERCRLEQDFDLLRHLGAEPSSHRPHLVPPGKAEAYAREFISGHGLESKRLVGVCIGAHWLTKRWPVENLAQLCLKVTALGLEPLLFGGPEESDVENEVRATLRRLDGDCRATDLYSCLGNSLVESLALLQRCSVVVGPDSGLTHLARAAGTQTVVLYGPTDHGLHVHAAGSTALYADIECRPCHRHGQKHCPLGHHKCMRDLSPEAVIAAVVARVRTGGHGLQGRSDGLPVMSELTERD